MITSKSNCLLGLIKIVYFKVCILTDSDHYGDDDDYDDEGMIRRLGIITNW